MGCCSSNADAVRQRPGLSEEQIGSISTKTPQFLSPKVALHLISLDTALHGEALHNRESFQSIQINFSVVWALLLGVAATGVLMGKPEKSEMGELFMKDCSFLGTIFCFCFLCFLVATFVSLLFIIMTLSISNDDEFQHWVKLLGPTCIKMPIWLGFMGIIGLLVCIAENMTVAYDWSYTGVCLLKCFILVLVPLYYIPHRMTWAALITKETAVEIDRVKRRPTAQSIRECLITDYFERELERDATRLNRADFMGRFMRSDEHSDFVIKLAARIYDDFEEAKIQEMLAEKEVTQVSKEGSQGTVLPGTAVDWASPRERS